MLQRRLRAEGLRVQHRAALLRLRERAAEEPREALGPRERGQVRALEREPRFLRDVPALEPQQRKLPLQLRKDSACGRGALASRGPPPLLAPPPPPQSSSPQVKADEEASQQRGGPVCSPSSPPARQPTSAPPAEAPEPRVSQAQHCVHAFAPGLPPGGSLPPPWPLDHWPQPPLGPPSGGAARTAGPAVTIALCTCSLLSEQREGTPPAATRPAEAQLRPPRSVTRARRARAHDLAGQRRPGPRLCDPPGHSPGAEPWGRPEGLPGAPWRALPPCAVAQVILDLLPFENILVRRALDTDSALLGQLGVSSVPACYLIHPNGSRGLVDVGKPLRSFYSSYLKSLPEVRKKQLLSPEKPSKEAASEGAVWRDFDRSKLYTADLESGLHYLLRVELATRRALAGAELKALRDFVTVLAKLLPSRPPVRKLLEMLQEWLTSLPLDRVPYSAILDLVDNKMRVRVLQVWFQNRRAKEKRLKKDAGRQRWGQYFRSMKRARGAPKPDKDSGQEEGQDSDAEVAFPDEPAMAEMGPAGVLYGSLGEPTPALGRPAGAPSSFPLEHGGLAGPEQYAELRPSSPYGVPPSPAALQSLSGPQPLLSSLVYPDAGLGLLPTGTPGGPPPMRVPTGNGPSSDLSTGSSGGYPDFPASPASWLDEVDRAQF
ncbi:PREDICTED: LIM/homeobox protein Lhx3 [Condylura cristata]|uniref:LIM/homeobox protein Lhx3 n=1 Tax=Condylura cristata TaxID=143302 RepID=UPI000642E912|nr:PREDICTED: LIM/homeobox protein Lhx3 [Condylura cristata]